MEHTNLQFTPKLRKKLEKESHQIHFLRKHQLTQSELNAILFIYDSSHPKKRNWYQQTDDLTVINIHYLLCKSMPLSCRGCMHYNQTATIIQPCKYCKHQKERA